MARHGFIKDKLDIKIMLLYILRQMAIPLSFDQITELVRYSDDGVDFFLYAESLDELVMTDHVAKSADSMYLITDKGRENGEITETGIPLSVRRRVDATVKELTPDYMRNALISAELTDREDGCCTVSLTLSDGVGEIMKLEMLTGSREQAKGIARNFRRSAELIYNSVLEDLTRQY